MTKVTSEIAAGLAAVPYLALLPVRERAALAARCLVRSVRRGAVIFEEGAPATGLWVVLAGRVKLVRVSASGREQVLHAEAPGATLAEVPVFDGGGYVATAVAIDDARLLFVPRVAVLDVCRRHGEVALGVIAVLAGRVRTFARLIEDLALSDVTTRVARFLLAEARRRGDDVVELPGTREDIGARLGTVRELVSRALGRLRADGVIAVRGRTVRVCDRTRLTALARSQEDTRP
jgi:CRP/FNR family transcriptional regulator, dissimilatory nitrate respiration regulator